MADRPMKKGNNTVQDTELPSHGLLSLPILLTHGYVDITTTLHNTNHKLPQNRGGPHEKLEASYFAKDYQVSVNAYNTKHRLLQAVQHIL